MTKFVNIASECLAIAVLYKIMLKPKGEVALILGLPFFLQGWIIFIVLILLFFKATSNIARLILSGIATFSFLFYEVYSLSPQSFFFLIAAMFIYFLFALIFRRSK